MVGWPTHLGGVLVVGDGGQGAEVAPDDRRRAEIGNRQHKAQDGARTGGREHQRQRDLEEALPTCAAQVLGGFLERAVDVAQRALGHQVDEGEKLQAEHQDDAVNAVDGGQRHPQRLHLLGQPAIVAGHHHPGIGTDERRRHQRQNRQRGNEAAPA
jgi:hypothetical protein